MASLVLTLSQMERIVNLYKSDPETEAAIIIDINAYLGVAGLDTDRSFHNINYYLTGCNPHTDVNAEYNTVQLLGERDERYYKRLDISVLAAALVRMRKMKDPRYVLEISTLGVNGHEEEFTDFPCHAA